MEVSQPLPAGRNSPPKGASGSRVSLACLPCRTRHVRCDAKKPRCNRCCEENKECNYAKSRRGGLDRAALAARRSQAAALAATKSNGQLSPAGSIDGGSGGVPVCGIDSDVVMSRDGSQPALDVLGSSLLVQQQPPLDPSLFTPPDDAWSSSSVILPSSDLQSLDITKDAFIDVYYNCFHRYHPCVLPRRFLERYLRDPLRQDELRPLICVMRFVGSIYLSSHQPSLRAKCHQLEELASSAIAQVPTTSCNFFMIQCHLIYSACLYWRGNPAKSKHHMSVATQLALDVGMHHHEFAVDHGNGDPVLEESWRRTWWQVFIIEAYYSAIKRSADFSTYHIEATTDLPCEEDEYERGLLTILKEIPRPKTLEEFNSREFIPEDTVFSSFAYLIGGIRGMASAMFRALSLPANSSDSAGSSPKVLESVDSIIEGWLLLLPESKRDIFSADGQVDELVFQAMMALHATTVGLHRPFSNCEFDPLECISSCSTPPPAGSRSDSGAEFRLIHTIKCIRAAEAQIGLLALPTKPCSHTPFVVCMLTTGTLSLLAACRYTLRGQKLAVARDQIRMSIGCHKAMANVWSQAGSNLHEVQAIAREVLGLPMGNNKQIKTPLNQIPPSPGPPSISGPDLSDGSCSSDTLSSFPIDNLQTYWNMGSIQPDLSFAWWTSSDHFINHQNKFAHPDYPPIPAMARTQKIAPSKRSRAARRATSPSIDTDKSLKSVSLPASSTTESSSAAARPSVLAARHSAGVTKKSKRGRQLSAKGRRRQEKGLEMAEAFIERTSKKLEKSIGKARVVQARSKKWDAINKAVQESKNNAFAVLSQGDGEGGEAQAGEWETDEEMDGDNAAEGNSAAAQSAVAAPALDDDDDEIL
ncbi:c6 zinc finger domain-containing [Trichoderma arundinaceum]|uniref:C6 zinc finger domain-containing n=1 Tax=Trichoderma arundinaceum TaxID=490622 RepID=A0A395NWB0_TRIAR|nr:c6 zinc finger domain-containing [Trichoderma arundinaceum]